MTEEKEKLSEFLKEQFKTHQENLLKLMDQKLNGLKSTSNTEEKPPKPPEKHAHTHHSAEVEFECTECKNLYDKKVIDGYKEKLKTLKEPVICEGCGEIVEKTEEECPTCKGTKASKIN